MLLDRLFGRTSNHNNKIEHSGFALAPPTDNALAHSNSCTQALPPLVNLCGMIDRPGRCTFRSLLPTYEVCWLAIVT